MENILDLIATDASASDISDSIKDALFAKAATGVESQRPNIALSMFDVETETDTNEDPE